MIKHASKLNTDGRKLLSEFVSKAEVAQEFSVSERTVERWVRLRLLPKPLKMGRSILFHRDALKAHFLARLEEPDSPERGPRRRRQR